MASLLERSWSVRRASCRSRVRCPVPSWTARHDDVRRGSRPSGDPGTGRSATHRSRATVRLDRGKDRIHSPVRATHQSRVGGGRRLHGCAAAGLVISLIIAGSLSMGVRSPLIHRDCRNSRSRSDRVRIGTPTDRPRSRRHGEPYRLRRDCRAWLMASRICFRRSLSAVGDRVTSWPSLGASSQRA